MAINQDTRDKLREKQYELQSTIIGAIIEHRIEDPARYKRSGRTRPSHEDIARSLDEVPQTSGENKSKKIEVRDVKKTIVDINSKNVESDRGGTSKEPATADSPQVNEDALPIKMEEVCQGKWINMDKLEFDKLAWIMQENRAKVDSLQGSSKQARFNIEGKLVLQTKDDGQSMDIPTHLGLHHHGDEPDMAGYTIEELLCYLNSSYERQRVLAMNVLGNIVMWAHRSSYDNIFDLNITTLILNESLLTVRVNLDSSNETTVISALRCLHAFICNTNIDEMLLDKAFFLLLESPSSSLWLKPNCWSEDNPNPKESTWFPDDMSDADCVKKDPIVALVERTELITRLRYLLEVRLSEPFKNDHTIHDCIFDILIRIARHSPRICAYLAGYPYLLQAIQEKFLPLVITSKTLEMKKPSVKALKFIRVIASADLEDDNNLTIAQRKESIGQASAAQTYASYFLNWELSSIVPILLSYICIEPITENKDMSETLLQISIEALRCWSVFLQLKSIRDEVTNYFTGVLQDVKVHINSLKNLEAIKRGEDGKVNVYDWQYAAGIINVLDKLSRTLSSAARIFLPDVSYLVFKWTREIIGMNMIPNLNVSLALTCAIDLLIRNNHDIVELQQVFLKSMTSKAFLKLITKGCLPRTPITLSEKYSGCIRDPSNLPSFGGILFNRTTTQNIKLTPFLEENSPFLLFRSIIECLTIIKCSPQILSNFFKDHALHDYLMKIRNLDACADGFEVAVKSRLFEQCELLTVSKAVLMICQYYMSVDEKHINATDYDEEKHIEGIKKRLQCYDTLFTMAMTCVSLMSPGSKEAEMLRQNLLYDIVLNSKFYERLIDELSPSMKPIDKLSYGIEKEEIDYIPVECAKVIYDDCKFSTKLWLFEPLIKYYSRQQEIPTNDQEEKRVKNETQHTKLSRIDEDQVMIDAEDDVNSIIVVLSLISRICKNSKIYSQLVIKPNLEDCLCLVGTVFLTDELFLDTRVSCSLKEVVLTLLAECIDPINEQDMPFQNPAKKLSGINLSVYDFFIKLVDQFEGASYGDPTFSNFLMLFLTPKSHPSHKRYLFSEKASTCISQMRIGRDEVWISEKILYSRKEEDKEIIGLYRQCASTMRKKPFSAIQTFLNFHIS